MRIEVRVSAEERAILDRLVEGTGLSASDVIRMLIRGRTLAVHPTSVPPLTAGPDRTVAVQAATNPTAILPPVPIVNTGPGVPLRRRRPCDGKQVPVRLEGEIDPGAKRYTSLDAALRGK